MFIIVITVMSMVGDSGSVVASATEPARTTTSMQPTKQPTKQPTTLPMPPPTNGPTYVFKKFNRLLSMPEQATVGTKVLASHTFNIIGVHILITCHEVWNKTALFMCSNFFNPLL